MPNREGHRRFGNVRQRTSGRWQARYLGRDGLMRSAPTTFESKRAAERWLSIAEGEIARGEWIDPLAGNVTLRVFGAEWITDRQLSSRTRELYEGLFRLHVDPYLGILSIGEVGPSRVRAWRTALADDGRSATTLAKAYRLLRAIMNTALDDELIRRNPCRIAGAGQEATSERPVATVAQVFALADAVPHRFRALILCAAFTALRWGELVAMRRSNLDMSTMDLRVPRRTAELNDGTLEDGPPKSAAGFRTVSVPKIIERDLRRHLRQHAKGGPDTLIFTGAKGAQLRRSNFRRAIGGWAEAVENAGLPAEFHFHDLRHTGNNLAAAAGASTRELMHRMGHGSMRAALIYQHATRDRDREIAAAMSKRAQAEVRRNRSKAKR